MIERLLDDAAASQHEAEQRRLIVQMAASPDEMLPIALQALRQPTPVRQLMAVRVIRAIGYPRNARAIGELLFHISEPNFLGWDEAVQTLAEMGPDVVVPQVIARLLDQGRTDPYWAENIEGFCLMLRQMEPVYARRCCPALIYLLSRGDLPAQIDRDYLLDVIERAGKDQTYVLPALIALAQTSESDEIRVHAQRLIASFPADVLSDYALSERQES